MPQGSNVTWFIRHWLKCTRIWPDLGKQTRTTPTYFQISQSATLFYILQKYFSAVMLSVQNIAAQQCVISDNIKTRADRTFLPKLDACVDQYLAQKWLAVRLFGTQLFLFFVSHYILRVKIRMLTFCPVPKHLLPSCQKNSCDMSALSTKK